MGNVDYSKCIEKGEFIELLKNASNKSQQSSTKQRSSSISGLSIREIKERLKAMNVDYSGCLEASELVELLVAKEQGHSNNPFRDSKGVVDAKENGDDLSRSKGAKEGGETMYIVETSLHDLEIMQYKPSMLASAAIRLGLAILGRPAWSATLGVETKYNEEELQGCVE